MKPLFTLVIALFTFQLVSAQAVLTAVFDGPLSGGTPKGVEIYFIEDVADLSLLGVSSANNGSGPTGTPEYTLPSGSALAGQYIYISSEADNFEAFFGFAADYVDGSGSVNINGDDAVELFYDGAVIDVFGDVNVDGTGTAWEHLDGWAARLPNTGPDGENFQVNNWIYSGVDALDNETSNATAANPVPIKAYSGGVVLPDYTVDVRNNFFNPAVLVVDPGDVVEWDCTEGAHNVNGSQGTYPNNTEDFFSGSAELAPWTYQHTFTTPGYNDYQCDPHFTLGMTGAVMVREEGDYHVDVLNNEFVPRDITIELGETIVWTNVSGIHNVNGGTNTFPNNPEEFHNGTASENWSFAHTFMHAGTYDYQCDPHVSVDMIGTVTVTSPYQVLDMPTVKQTDADGVAIYQDSLVEVAGVVHGPNYRAIGVEFFLIDASNRGVLVRTTATTPAYTVTEGDALVVRGVIDQFNGLIQLVPSMINVNSTGNALVNPTVVTTPTEDTEGSFIRIEGLVLVDTAQWPGPGTSANVQALSGSDTVIIRIDSDIDFDIPAPLGVFHVMGLGSQFDGSSPYTEGYQILPRSGDDILDASGTVAIEDIGVNMIYPNPVQSQVTIESDEVIERIRIFDAGGRFVNQVELNTKVAELDLSILNVGIYHLQLTTSKGVATTSIVKQ